MISSLNIGYSGLLAFSKGLDAISGNVANLNTVGFKSSQLVFRDLLYYQGHARSDNGSPQLILGQGVDVPASRIRFKPGEFRSTGNPLDTAIDGNGFFILKKDDQTMFTRNGQFEFGADGYLVSRVNGAQVMRLNGSGLGGLDGIQINQYLTSPPRATGRVSFAGNLSRGGTTHQLTSVAVIDSTGGSHNLSLTFTNNNAVTSGSWLVEVRDATNAIIANGEIRFQGNGSPAAGFNQMIFAFTPAGVPASNITLFFGDPGSFAGATNFSAGTTSDLRVSAQDGYASGSILNLTVNASGYLVINYSNGQTQTIDRLALAWFMDLQALTQNDEGMFTSPGTESPAIAGAGENVMGGILSGQVELSNVELTEEFTDMVVIQRGYQASSQVISVANEMIQQTIEIAGRRG